LRQQRGDLAAMGLKPTLGADPRPVLGQQR
jgi:hypothetical protein